MCYLRVYRVYLDQANFYLCRDDSLLQQNHWQWQIPYFKRATQSRFPSAKWLLKPYVTYDVYIMAKKKNVTWSFPPELFSEEMYFKREQTEILAYGILVGSMILTIAMSLFLFTQSREAIYWYYSLYSLCSTFLILSMGGVLNYFLGHDLRILTGPESQFFYAVGFTCTNVLFTHTFFQIEALGPRWLYVVGKILVVGCLACSLLFIINYRFVYQVKLLYIFIIFIGVIGTTVIYSLKTGNKLAKFYYIAFLPLIVTLSLTVFSDLGYIKQTILLFVLGPFSVLFEILVLLIGLTFRLYAFQQKKQQFENELIAQQIQTQESERQRIAADLHDDLGGTLATIRRRIADIRQNLKDPKAAKDFELLEPLIQKSSDDLRRISHNLMPPEFAHLGLASALQQFVQAIPHTPTHFEFLISGKERKLPMDIELNLYRIVSELVQNILKHAQATRAAVQLIYFDDLLTITVEDNGVGNRLINKLSKISDFSLGIGLKNSRLRAEYIGAKLLMETSAGGTLLILEMPYPPTGNDASPDKNTSD